MYNVFSDESCQNTHHYLVLGGVIVAQSTSDELAEEIAKKRAELHLYDEMKWSKVSNAYLSKYKETLDLFFTLNNRDEMHFHSLIVNSHQLNHHKFNAGDHDLGLNKFFYQLLIHKFGRKYTEGPLHIYLDSRNSTHPLEELRNVLNNGMGVFNNPTRPFKKVDYVDSKANVFIQLNDILIGAIGWHKNEQDRKENASKAKTDLANYIAQKAGLSRLGETSAYLKTRFTIWNFKLSK